MTSQILALVAVLSLLPAIHLNATSIFDLLTTAPSEGTSEAVEVVIRLPLDSIYSKTSNEQTAVLSFTDRTGLAQRWPLHVDVRGKFRRRICTFPPLKLNFSKKHLSEKGLTKHDKLKLVTPCTEDDNGQELVLKEYLAYRLLNQLTPASFRVQLLKVTYIDIHNVHPDRTAYAFVLEDTDELAARLGGDKMDNGRGIAPTQFDRRAEITQALFSYFIGNTDWSLASGHNLKMIKRPDGTVIPVPYDFDFSALVGAPYATPNSSVGQATILDRVYLGYDATDGELSAAIAVFEEHRRELLKFVRHFNLLSLDERYAAAAYLTDFFHEVKSLRKNSSKELTVYNRLRGEQTEIVPAGATPAYYGVGKK